MPNLQTIGCRTSCSAPMRSTSFSRKCPCVGISASVVGSPFSSIGRRNSIAFVFPRKTVVAYLLHRYCPGARSIAFFQSLWFGVVVLYRVSNVSVCFSSCSFSRASCRRDGSSAGIGACSISIGYHAISFSCPAGTNFFCGCTRMSRPILVPFSLFCQSLSCVVYVEQCSSGNG